MVHLIIRNVGPIKDVDIELNQINVIIGMQSSGKSTIAKIISFCSWLEKQLILKAPSETEQFDCTEYFDKLKSFHRFSDGYFQKESYIEYTTEHFELKWYLLQSEKSTFNVELSGVEFVNRKISFIPAERNFVSVIPVSKYSESYDNISNFINDWFDAKQSYNKQSLLEIPVIHSLYYYDKDKDKDVMLVGEHQTEIPLRSASSGFQSILPLWVLIEYMTKGLFEKERTLSPFNRILLRKLIDRLDLEPKLKQLFYELIDKIETYKSVTGRGEEDWIQLVHAIGIELNYTFSRLIIEEPEQNLFPETQKELLYSLIKSISNNERKHELIITTHSPYLLYALNNCMLGGLVKDKLSKEELENINFSNAFIHPSFVSVFQIADGAISIIQKEDGLIGNNYFDENMKDVMDDFYLLLEHYGDDD